MSRCPICGERATYVVETVKAFALIDESGEYLDESEVDWDSQEPLLTDGKRTLGHGTHQWLDDPVEAT